MCWLGLGHHYSSRWPSTIMCRHREDNKVIKYAPHCFRFFYPRPPSVPMGIVIGHWVLLSSHLSVRLSVCPSWTMFPLWLFKDFSYQPQIWWDDAQYHGADGSLKLPCSANFCMFQGTLKFSMMGLGQEDEIEDLTLRPEIWCHDAVSRNAYHCMKWPHSANVKIFRSRPSEGAVILWTSC